MPTVWISTATFPPRTGKPNPPHTDGHSTIPIGWISALAPHRDRNPKPKPLSNSLTGCGLKSLLVFMARSPALMTPVRHRLASVSVAGKTCAEADAWATALMVLGPKQAWEVVQREWLSVLLLMAKGAGFEQKVRHEHEHEHGCCCGKGFESIDDLIRHLLQCQDGLKGKTCPVCGHTFAKVAWLKTHLATHQSIRDMWMCLKCGHLSRSKGNLKRHAVAKHDHSREDAVEEDKDFVMMRNVDVKAMAKKKQDKRLAARTCGMCGEVFGSRAELTRHVRTHTGEKPFGCEVCPAKFSEKGTLKKHMLQLHPMK